MQNLQWAARFICRARLQSITVEVRHLKITAVSAVYPNYRNVPASWRTHFWQIVVRVETDAGVTGFGYGAKPGAPNFGHFVAAYSIDAFTDIGKFKDEMDCQSHP
mgnify:CR=1 FL=1